MSNTISASSATVPSKTDGVRGVSAGSVNPCTCGNHGRYDADVVVVCAACQKCGGLASALQTRQVQDMVNRELLGHTLPIAAFLSTGDGVIDIGANTGKRSRAFAKAVGASGFVLAIEPDPKVADSCRTACTDLAHVRVLQAAISERTGRALLHRDATDSRRSSLHPANVIQTDGEQVDVPCMTLDSLLDLVPKLRGIKVDAQGSELNILRGANTTLQRRDLVWHVELWPVGLKHAGGSVGEVAGIFMHAGYMPVMGNWWRVLEWARHATGHQHLDLVLWCPQ